MYEPGFLSVQKKSKIIVVNMKKYVCLRDDDTNYHTKPEELAYAYGDFWGKEPVTLATVPFSHGSQQKVVECEKYGSDRDKKHREWVKNASAEELTEYHRTWPIGLNKSLVDTLKPMIANGFVEIALHGVHHAYNERGPEMFSNEIGFEAIRDGKEYLEKVFCTDIVTFIPPSNTIDVTCVGYLIRLHMHLFSSGSIVKDNTTIPTHDLHSYFVSARRRLLRHEPLPMKKNYGIMQFSSFTFGVNSRSDIMFERIKKELESTGFSALGTHYSIFKDKELRNVYIGLLKRLKDELDVNFVTAKEYYNLIKKEYYA